MEWLCVQIKLGLFVHKFSHLKSFLVFENGSNICLSTYLSINEIREIRYTIKLSIRMKKKV